MKTFYCQGPNCPRKGQPLLQRNKLQKFCQACAKTKRRGKRSPPIKKQLFQCQNPTCEKVVPLVRRAQRFCSTLCKDVYYKRLAKFPGEEIMKREITANLAAAKLKAEEAARYPRLCPCGKQLTPRQQHYCCPNHAYIYQPFR